MEDVWPKAIRYSTGKECWHKLCALRHDSGVELKFHKRLLSEVKYYLKKYRTNKFEFVDFCNLNHQELDRFCRAIAQRKISIEWSAPVVIDPDIKPGYIARMKQAGCRKVVFELFSASDSLLSKIGARFTAKDALELLKAYRQAGINIGINLVFGHPLEEESDRKKTLDFLHENIGLIDEITSLMSCSETFAISYPFFGGCCRREQCFNSVKDNRHPVFAKDFNSFISKIYALDKPVVHIYPPKTVFNEFEKHTLRDKNLFFYFHNGKGGILLDGREVTSGLGMYASIFANGIWQDSEHADWQVNKVNDRRAIFRGKWHSLPVIQTWDIELREKTVIRVKIEMEILRQIVIEGEQQVNVMLRDEYSQWSSSNGIKGTAPALFNSDWPTLFEEKNKVISSIGIEADTREELPRIALCDKAKNEGYYMAMLNTSDIFNARVLKCYKTDNKRYSSGRYLYFDGEIRISN